MTAREDSDPAGGEGPASRCAILAGGAGSRIGEPKPGVLLAGRPLISYVIASAREAGLDPFVVAKPSTPLPTLDCKIEHEPERPRHPLVGVVWALQLHVEPVLVAPCDTPLVPPELMRELAARPEPVAAVSAAGRLQPLLARYAPSALPQLRRELAGERPIAAILRSLGAAELAIDERSDLGPAERILHNVNTPGDLATAEALLAGRR